jgi:hypothetical protein
MMFKSLVLTWHMFLRQISQKMEYEWIWWNTILENGHQSMNSTGDFKCSHCNDSHCGMEMDGIQQQTSTKPCWIPVDESPQWKVPFMYG